MLSIANFSLSLGLLTSDTPLQWQGIWFGA